MSVRLVPSDIKKAMDLLRANPAHEWTVDALAVSCGSARRTLEKHFRRFIGQAPMAYVRSVRLEQARTALLNAEPPANVTAIATQCGFNHLGRFAMWYRGRYGETPSATLLRAQSAADLQSRFSHSSLGAVDRPSIAVLPFVLISPEARRAAGLNDAIAAALCRLNWVTVVPPCHARYQLQGKVRDNGLGQLRVTITLLDARTRRLLWAGHCDGSADDAFGLEDRVAAYVTGGVPPVLRNAEFELARRTEPEQLSAWGLVMRALPKVHSFEPAAEDRAMAWLGQAMELAPHDPLPASVAAWCHGQRASHYLAPRPDRERAAARSYATRARLLDCADPLAETMLAAAYTLAHDLETACFHADRALALDAGSAWAWGRKAWIHACRGEVPDAIEHFQIARNLAPADPLTFLCSIGIASAHFEAGRYGEAVRWYRLGLAEQPKAVLINRFLAPSLALAGRKEEAERSFADLTRAFPDLTIAQVKTSLPHSQSYLDRAAEGLESAGLPAG